MDEDGGGGEIAQAHRSDELAQSGTDGATSGGLGGQAAPAPRRKALWHKRRLAKT